MNDKSYVELLYELAITNISSSGYKTPTEYLIWLLTHVNKLFDDDEKFIFSNIQFIPLIINNTNLVSHGRLKNIPTLINVEGFAAEKLNRLGLEVFSFLLASGLIEERPFGNVISLLRTFKDKFIIEVVKGKNPDQNNEPIKFDEKDRMLSIFVPDFFDEKIAGNYFTDFLGTMDESVNSRFDNRLIVDDKNFVDAFSKVMMSETRDKFIEEINTFFKRKDIQTLNEDYKFKLDVLNKKLSIKMGEKELDQFVKMIFIHSWLKSTRYSYQITMAKFDRLNDPLSFGVFLITSENKITTNKLNLLHIALNIAFNNISDFLGINSDIQANQAEQTKTIISKSEKAKKSPVIIDSIQFLYKDPKMRSIDYEISKYAKIDVPVLITGETGVGKDLAAYLIHKRSLRTDKEFVRIPIKNLAESLIESELFGYEKGAFTGASERKIGKLESADAGTVYLPEISELSKNTQLKLLEFLQYQTIDRIGAGADAKRKLNVRLIFASNENLEDLVEEGKIRQDFYYRIKVATVHIPPLRERKDDIVMLANFFLEKYSEQMLGQKYRFEDGTLNYMKELDWKGNVRELENSIIRAIIVSDDYKIGIRAFEELQINGRLKGNGEFKIQNLNQAERDFKKEYFKNILEHTEGNISKASQIAGISRQNLYRIMKELEL